MYMYFVSITVPSRMEMARYLIRGSHDFKLMEAILSKLPPPEVTGMVREAGRLWGSGRMLNIQAFQRSGGVGG